MKEYAFGIDLGGTTAKIGLFKTTGELLEKWDGIICYLQSHAIWEIHSS